jgi:hypothetical protein
VVLETCKKKGPQSSQDTALRNIDDLLTRRVLRRRMQPEGAAPALFAGPARRQRRLSDCRVAPAIAIRAGGVPTVARLGSGAILSLSRETPPPFQLGQHRLAEKLVVVAHARQLAPEV